MEILTNKQFNEQMRERSMKMAVAIHHLLSTKKVRSTSTSLINQLIRSSSSVAANYRSAGRGRSDAEFYSKICIVVEECDETQFWIDFLIRINILTTEETKELRDEIEQQVKIFTSIKKKMKDRLGK
jgi:four helix bundle protein